MDFGAWRGAALAAIRDWRRYAPAAGSVAAHAAVFLGIGAMMAVAPPKKGMPKLASPPLLAVELVTTDVAPPPRPAPRAAAPSDAAPLPPRRKAERQPAQRPAPPSAGAPATTATSDVAAIPLPEGPAGVPLGLRKLLETNPCGDRLEKVRGHCNLRWAKLAEQAQLGYSPTLDQLAALYPEYVADDPSIPAWAPVAMGVLSSFVKMSVAGAIGGEAVMPSGPAGGAGIENQAGRLAKGYADPVFETAVPQWLGFDHPARLPPVRNKN